MDNSQAAIAANKKNIKLIVQYDGTDFHGFQKQKSGARTVQGVVEKALLELTGEEIETAGAARTDAGVHALGQTMSFFTATHIPPERIAPALRPLLPEDAQAVSSCEVSDDFNARFSALGKEYHYTMYTSPVRIPTLRNSALHVYKELDVEEMKKALELLRGEHDFSALRNEGSVMNSPVRTIYSADVRVNGIFTTVVVDGSGFLYKMVRNIAGLALEVGTGALKAAEISDIIESRDRRRAARTLPPHGLCLARVYYEAGEGEAGGRCCGVEK